MKFHNYIDIYGASKRKVRRWPNGLDANQFYLKLIEGRVDPAHLLTEDVRIIYGGTEGEYLRQNRPYYKIWPAFVRALTKVKLDLRVEDMPKSPARVLALRFAEGKELESGGRKICSILTLWANGIEDNLYSPICFLTVLSQYWIPEITDRPMTVVQEFDSEFEGTIQEEFDKCQSYKIWSDKEVRDSPEIKEIARDSLKISLGVQLLADDSDFVKPEVLSKDQIAYETSGDPKYLDKAKRRGVVGWTLGKDFETIPHFRKPHLGLRWTGKGKKVPKIVPVKGSIVHKKLVEKVPTGYLGRIDDGEIENEFEEADS